MRSDLPLDSPGTARPAWPARVTVAHAAFGAIVALAAVMRWVDLGALPLSSAEAVDALAAWARGHGGSATALSPFYANLTGLLLLVARADDAVVRLVPALLGVALVGTTWALRGELGGAGVLAAALLLAASPVHSTLARTAGGDGPALLAVALLALALLRYDRDGRPGWLGLAALALGAGVTTSPLFYTGALTFVPAWLLWRGSAAPDRATARDVWQRVGLAALPVAVALATALLFMPGGLGESADIVQRWLGHFSLTAPWSTRALPLVNLFAFESAVWLLAALVLYRATRADAPRNRSWALLCLTWSAAAIGVTLLQDGPVANAALVVLPLYWWFGAELGAGLRGPFTWRSGLATGLVALILFASLTNLGRYVYYAVGDPSFIVNLLVIVMVLLLFVPMLVYLALEDPTAAVHGVTLGALLFAAFLLWGNGWWLSHSAANDPRTLWATDGTHPAVRELRATLRETSLQQTQAATELPLQVALDTPTLRWYLRDFSAAAFGGALVPGSAPVAGVVSAEVTPELDGAYVRHTFAVHQHEAVPAATPRTSVGTLRWWLFRYDDRPVTVDFVTVWLRDTRTP